MSVWLDSPGSRPRDRIALPAGLAVVLVGLALVVGEARFRVAEARVSAWVLRLVRLRPASSLGDNVVFPLHGQWVGFSLSVACTAALLIMPFFIVAGLLMLSGRVDRRRALVALALTSVIIFIVNQLRMLVIAGSMMLWGFKSGYERSHILLGTVLSTVGVIIGIIIFCWMLVSSPDGRRRGVRT
jgi:exosortase/archaeosortase family protein